MIQKNRSVFFGSKKQQRQKMQQHYREVNKLGRLSLKRNKQQYLEESTALRTNVTKQNMIFEKEHARREGSKMIVLREEDNVIGLLNKPGEESREYYDDDGWERKHQYVRNTYQTSTTFTSKHWLSPYPHPFIPHHLTINNSHFTHGYLPHTGYFYFTTQRSVHLVHATSYSDHPTAPNLSANTPSQIIHIYEVITPHHYIFAGHQVILVMLTSWRVHFWALKRQQLVDLHISYGLHCELISCLTHDKLGNLYYLDQYGLLYKLQFYESSSLLPTHHQYKLKNTLCKGGVNTHRKRTDISNYNLLQTLRQLYKDVAHYMRVKTITPKCIKYDQQNKLIYTLVHTCSQAEHNHELRVYQIEGWSASVWEWFRDCRPVLLHTHTEDSLYRSYSSKLYPITLEQFVIDTIQVVEHSHHPVANLMLVLGNGSRLYVKVREQQMRLVEVLGLPDVRELKGRSGEVIEPHIGGRARLLSQVRFGSVWAVTLQSMRKSLTLFIHDISNGVEEVSAIEWAKPPESSQICFIHHNLYRYQSRRGCVGKGALSDCIHGNPLVAQVHHEPAHLLYVHNSWVYVACQLRPIDMLFGCLRERLEKDAVLGIEGVRQFEAMYGEGQGRKGLVSRVELEVMVVQLFCDVEGKYFDNQTKSNRTSKLAVSTCTFQELKESTFINNLPELFKYTQNQQSGLLLYLSRLTHNLKTKQIQLIKKPQLLYLNEVLQRALILLTNEQQSIRTTLHKLIELHKLIYTIETLPKVPYSEAISLPPQHFQQYIFSHVQMQYKPNLIEQWKLLFPSFVSRELYRVVKFYEEISLIEGKKQVMQLVGRENKFFPFYFVQYLMRQRGIKEAEFLLDNRQHSDTSQLSSLTPLAKIYEALEQIQLENISLDKKLLLISHAEKTSHQLQTPVTTLSNQIEETHLCLKLQQKIRQQYLLNQNCNRETLYTLTHIRLDKKHLQQLVNKINNSKLLIMFHIFFPTDSQPSTLRQNITRLYHSVKKIKKVREQLGEIFKQMLISRADSIILRDLLEALDECMLEVIEKEELQLGEWLQKGNDEVIWVGCFMIEEGWNQFQIHQHYMDKWKQHIRVQSRLALQNTFLYYWLNGYQQVSKYYTEGRRLYITCTKNILSKMESSHEADEVMGKMKLLLNRLMK